MIESYKHKGLKELFEKGRTARIDKNLHRKVRSVLDVLNRANTISEVNQPGYFLHPLKQFTPWRYSVWINGQWRLTFEFINGAALHVDFEQYH